VLIYNHGKPKEDDDLDSLAKNLLEHVISERKGDVRHFLQSMTIFADGGNQEEQTIILRLPQYGRIGGQSSLDTDTK